MNSLAQPKDTSSRLAAIYVRVSSKEQVEGYSLDAQRRACRDLCAARGYTVVADYAVEGRDSSNHDGLLLAFDRAAEGATDAEVAEALNAAGYRPSATARRARFTRDATRAMLANRFFVGELPIGKRGMAGWLEGAHAP